MSMLRNLQVGTKIVAGFTVVLALMVVIGVVAILRFGQISATVSNLADDLAAEQRLSDEIVSQIWTARFFAQKYVNQQFSEDLERFNQELADFNQLLAQADEHVTDDQREQTLVGIQAGIQDFGNKFYQVVNLIDERNIISQGTLDVQGTLTDLKLDQLRESILETGDAIALYHAGNAQNAYLRIRLNTFRYLVTGDEQWVSERRYQEVRDAFQLLQEHLQDPAQITLAEEAEAAVEAYISGLSLIEADYAQQNQIVAEELNVIGPEVETAGAEMSASVAADFRAANQNTHTLVDQTRVMLIAAMGLAIVIGLGAGLAISYGITNPITSLIQVVRLISAGDLDQRAPVLTGDEVGELSMAFNSMAETIKVQTQELQASVQTAQERTRALELSAEVSRAASSILETEPLIRQVVELIRQRFNLYYVGLFLVDEAREWALLRAGTGEAGETMLARGHRLRINEGSMIGWSVVHAQARVALEAGKDAVRLATAELPDTRSEAAIPLRSRGQVIGALTVQSDQPGAFDEAIITVLQTMADQVAVALDNARLFAESQQALEAERRAYGEISREAWGQMARARGDWGYFCDEQDVFASVGDWQPEMAQAARDAQVVQTNDGAAPAVAIPLRVRDHVMGALGFYKAEKDEAWTEEEVSLLETLIEQLGLALESARLYQDTQQRAAREQMVGQVTTRIRETLDMETVLKTAAEEMRQALGLDKVLVRLAADQADGDSQ